MLGYKCYIFEYFYLFYIEGVQLSVLIYLYFVVMGIYFCFQLNSKNKR